MITVSLIEKTDTKGNSMCLSTVFYVPMWFKQKSWVILNQRYKGYYIEETEPGEMLQLPPEAVE